MTEITKAIAITKELLEKAKLDVALNHEREPFYSRALRDQIRLEDRLEHLLAEKDRNH